MSPEAIVAGLGVLFGGGTIAAIVQAVVSHKKGVRDADVARDQIAIAGFKDLAEELRKEVDRLKAAREEDRGRLDRIEDQIKVERDVRWAAVIYIRRLHDWIAKHMHEAGDMPPVPDSIAEHVYPPGDYPRPANSPKS